LFLNVDERGKFLEEDSVELGKHVVKGSSDVANLHEDWIGCSRTVDVTQLAQADSSVISDEGHVEFVGFGVGFVHDAVEDERAVYVGVENTAVEVGVYAEIGFQYVAFELFVVCEIIWQVKIGLTGL
jgi:hypothetical protein